MMVILTCVLVTVVAFVWYSHDRKNRKYGHIPGPGQLPLLGNSLQVLEQNEVGKVIPLSQILTKLARQYGPVMWVNVGFMNIVVLSGYEAIHEALVKKGADFADRPVAYRFKAAREDNGMFGMSYTPTCRVIRNIFHKALKVYGDGVDNLEKVVHESLLDLMAKLADKDGQPILVLETLMVASANSVYILLFGQQIDQSEATYPSLVNLEKYMTKGFEATTVGILIDNFPIMRYVFPTSFKKTLTFTSMRDDFWKKQIVQHKANWDGDEQRCLLDILLKEQKARSETDLELSDDHVLMALSNLFNAGFATSSIVLTGVVLMCLHKPELQEKLYAEVCLVVGATGQVSLKHRPQLHYSRALLLEALRYYSVVSLGLFHKTARDTSVGGYSVPKDTTVVINQWALHHDPDLWPDHDPWSFVPERFLNPDGSLVSSDHPNRKRLLPFGAGERVCVGENFAQNRLCLFLATLVQRFRFEPDDQFSMPSHDPRTWDMHILLQAPNFKAKFIPRV